MEEEYTDCWVTGENVKIDYERTLYEYQLAIYTTFVFAMRQLFAHFPEEDD